MLFLTLISTLSIQHDKSIFCPERKIINEIKFDSSDRNESNDKSKKEFRATLKKGS